jgi:hypothetical protein
MLPYVLAVISLVIVVFVSCGYSPVGAIVVVVAGSSPLIVVSVGPIIFR